MVGFGVGFEDFLVRDVKLMMRWSEAFPMRLFLAIANKISLRDD